MSYLTYSFNLIENQNKKLASPYNNKKATNIKIKFNQLTGNFPIMITNWQQNKIDKVIKDKVGFVLRMSESQVRKQLQNGGFLGALAGLNVLEEGVMVMGYKLNDLEMAMVCK